MKTLIYTLAGGPDPRFVLNVKMLTASLRKTGYAGDIAVITPDPAQYTGLDVRPIPVRPGRTHRWSVIQLKTAAFPLLKPAEYEAILFLDSDILAVRDVTPFFTHMRNAGQPCFATDPSNLGSEAGVSHMVRHATLCKIAGRPAANTGCFCITNRMAKTFIPAWRTMYPRVSGSWHCPEQQSLNGAWVLRKVSLRLYPRSWVEYPACNWDVCRRGKPIVIHTEDCKLLHFCSVVRGSGHQYMTRYFNEHIQ